MRVELSHIGGDIYLNGIKIAFAVDFTNPPVNPGTYNNVEWLLGWVKIGLMSHGHDVPHFEIREHGSFTPKLPDGAKAVPDLPAVIDPPAPAAS